MCLGGWGNEGERKEGVGIRIEIGMARGEGEGNRKPPKEERC